MTGVALVCERVSFSSRKTVEECDRRLGFEQMRSWHPDCPRGY